MSQTVITSNIPVTGICYEIISAVEMNITAERASEFIPIQYVRAHPEKRWDRAALSENAGITLNDVLALHLPNATRGWSWTHLSRNVPVDDILANPDQPWSISHLTGNPTIKEHHLPLLLEQHNRRQPNNTMTMAQLLRLFYSKFVEYVPLDISHANARETFPMGVEGVKDPDSYIQLSQYMPMKYIRENPHLPWNRLYLSANPEITLNDVLHLDLPNARGVWEWSELSSRVAMDDIRANQNLHVNLYPVWVPVMVLQNPDFKLHDMGMFKVI